MKQYRYVMVASDGTSHDFSRRTAYEDYYYDDLPDLLEQGWRPVREIPMGRGQWYETKSKLVEYPLILILLEKDGEERGREGPELILEHESRR